MYKLDIDSYSRFVVNKTMAMQRRIFGIIIKNRNKTTNQPLLKGAPFTMQSTAIILCFNIIITN